MLCTNPHCHLPETRVRRSSVVARGHISGVTLKLKGVVSSRPGIKPGLSHTKIQRSGFEVQPAFICRSRGFSHLRCSRESGRSGPGYRQYKSPISFIPCRSSRTGSRSFASICGSLLQPPGNQDPGCLTRKPREVDPRYNRFSSVVARGSILSGAHAKVDVPVQATLGAKAQSHSLSQFQNESAFIRVHLRFVRAVARG